MFLVSFGTLPRDSDRLSVAGMQGHLGDYSTIKNFGNERVVVLRSSLLFSQTVGCFL